MKSITQEILRSIEENHLTGISQLSPDEWESIYNNITAKYSDEGLSYHALWERLNAHVGHEDKNGWKTICQLIGNNGCLLLIIEDKSGFTLPDGATLELILNDTTGFVFYVTNKNADYLMCFNDHDFIIGCGQAEEWIARHYSIA